MNIQEFEDAILDADLTEDAVKRKWQKICHELAQLDVEIVSELIHNGFLEPLIELESMDGFGTEGLKL